MQGSSSETRAVAKLAKRTVTQRRRPKVNLWAPHPQDSMLPWLPWPFQGDDKAPGSDACRLPSPQVTQRAPEPQPSHRGISSQDRQDALGPPRPEVISQMADRLIEREPLQGALRVSGSLR